MIAEKLNKYEAWKKEEPKIRDYDSSNYIVSVRLDGQRGIITEKATTGLDNEKSLYIPLIELKGITGYLKKLFNESQGLDKGELRRSFRSSTGFEGDIEDHKGDIDASYVEWLESKLLEGW